jgi:YHS domain-containing protein
MLLRTLLLFLLILFLLRAFGRLMRGVVQGATQSESDARRRGQSSPVKMIADPVCGTYVVPGKALQLARGRETFYFCSERCRNQWLSSE